MNTFLDVIEIPKPACIKSFWPYGHFKFTDKSAANPCVPEEGSDGISCNLCFSSKLGTRLLCLGDKNSKQTHRYLCEKLQDAQLSG